MPKLCDKCGNYDPTYELTAEARCPCCGVLYAQLPQPSRAAEAPSLPAEPTPSPEAPAANWLPVRRVDIGLSIAAVCSLFAVILLDDDGFILLLDHANLAFHEAGHLFFGMLGSALGLYGGTLGQLVFPVVAGFSFWQRRQAVGLALSGVWLFENFLNIARYMADARTRLLPLVGGGEHDWYHIFSRWGLLENDTDVAAVTQTLGWIGMIGCLLWLWRRFSAQAAKQ